MIFRRQKLAERQRDSLARLLSNEEEEEEEDARARLGREGS